MSENTVSVLLERWARERRDETAYTFIDYEADPAGTAESLTFSELYEQTGQVAAALLKCGSPGDRAAILAPQGLEYIVGFLGAIEAGFVAVPLTMPLFGQHDERITGAVRDCTPVAVLTTSAVVDDIRPYTRVATGAPPPRMIEVDGLDYLAAPDRATRMGHDGPATAYLQYTSGSTRLPAGVVISHRNVAVNVEQLLTDYFEHHPGGRTPEDLTVVSWLPFYHDMGLVVGMLASLFHGRLGVIMTPVAFMQKPARWMQNLAAHTSVLTAAPNFAFEITLSRTTDADMAGFDLSGVEVMINGAERVHASTLRRFNERFAPFGLPESAIRPSYGLAEATVYVLSSVGGRPTKVVRLDADQLAHRQAQPCTDGGVEMVGCGSPRASTTIRIVDPESLLELPPGEVGEIWVHGAQVATGYWHNQELTARTFGGRLADPSPGTPQDRWLRTGDLGVLLDDELFIIGRIKDLLIIDGRNHYPDDIEATVIAMTAGRVAAVSVPDGTSEKLVVIAELRNPDPAQRPVLRTKVTSMVSMSHGVRVSDLVFVEPGSLPVTTSGKVRRSLTAEHYRQGLFNERPVALKTP